MRNKKTFRLAAFLLILTLITVTMLSGTFAKYASEFTGSDTALVAKWDIDFNGSTGGAITLDLFGHEYNKHIKQKDSDDFIIAPGVDGKFEFEVINSSDVDAKMTFEMALEAGSADVPLVFAIDGEAATYSAINALSTAIETKFGEIPHSNTGGLKSVKVTWEWPYGSETEDLGHDEDDTKLGTDSAAGNDRTKYTLIVTATAIQVAPDIE